MGASTGSQAGTPLASGITQHTLLLKYSCSYSAARNGVKHEIQMHPVPKKKSFLHPGICRRFGNDNNLCLDANIHAVILNNGVVFH